MAYGTNGPFGLKPYTSIVGGPNAFNLRPYKIATTPNGQTTYGTSIFTGDPVFWNGGDTNNQAGTISDQTGIQNGSTPLAVGVFQGCEYYDVNNVFQKKAYWPGGTRVYPGSSITAYILDDPFILYDVQVSTSNTTLADATADQSWFGDNAKIGIVNGGNPINNPGVGNTLTGISGYYLDGSSDVNAAQLYLLKIVDFTPNPKNLAAISLNGGGVNQTPYLNVLVTLNAHYFKSAGTVGPIPV